MVRCHACQREVSPEASRCPACGASQGTWVPSSKAMRRLSGRDKAWLVIAAAGGVLVVFVAAAIVLSERPRQAGTQHPAEVKVDPLDILASQIEIVSWQWESKQEGVPFSDAVGELKNNSAVPLGVILRITSRDSEGHAITSDEIFLNDTKIPPGGTRTFSYPVNDRGMDRSKGEIEVVGVRP